jgi:hypothetical protein
LKKKQKVEITYRRTLVQWLSSTTEMLHRVRFTTGRAFSLFSLCKGFEPIPSSEDNESKSTGNDEDMDNEDDEMD